MAAAVGLYNSTNSRQAVRLEPGRATASGNWAITPTGIPRRPQAGCRSLPRGEGHRSKGDDPAGVAGGWWVAWGLWVQVADVKLGTHGHAVQNTSVLERSWWGCSRRVQRMFTRPRLTPRPHRGGPGRCPPHRPAGRPTRLGRTRDRAGRARRAAAPRGPQRGAVVGCWARAAAPPSRPRASSQESRSGRPRVGRPRRSARTSTTATTRTIATTRTTTATWARWLHPWRPSFEADSLAGHLPRRVRPCDHPLVDAGRSVTVANGGCTLAAVREGTQVNAVLAFSIVMGGLGQPSADIAAVQRSGCSVAMPPAPPRPGKETPCHWLPWSTR